MGDFSSCATFEPYYQSEGKQLHNDANPLFVYPLTIMKYAQLCFIQAATVTTNHIDSVSETLTPLSRIH